MYESTCETVGSFVFEHELTVDSPSCGSKCGCNVAELEFAEIEHAHELAVDSPSCESTAGCNGAELEFADMKHELAVDCKDSEFEQADMS